MTSLPPPHGPPPIPSAGPEGAPAALAVTADTADTADTIDRMADGAPMLETHAVKQGRLDDTPASLVADYLKALPPLPRVGAVIAERWRIERLLGEGGFGAVFEGRDQQLGRKVAIKVMRAEGRTPADALAMREAITRMEERRRRFRDEARAVARAESPNVVTVYDVGEHGGDGDGAQWPFLVLELVEGTPLDRVVRERPTPEVALQILAQLVQGVATLHARGVVHRDLKPANAILTGDGRVKIIDFGLAIAASDWTEVKGPRAPEDWVEGTPVYMSPEVTAGADPDLHADLWALGVIAYELVTGRSPWGEHLSLAELERRIAHEPPLPLTPSATSDGAHARAAHLEPIVTKMLAKRREQRFQSALEIAQALSELRVTTRTPAPSRDAQQPFRYLLAFEEKDAGWFFGREDITAKLVLALEQRGRLVIAGPSGAGKTSLVQAGIIPQLKILRPLEVLRVQPGRDPLGRLAALVPALEGERVTADALRRQPGLVGERLRQRAQQTKKRVLVQVDALEELITQEAPAADVEVFGQALDGLRDDAARGVLLVMAVRDEYLGRLPRLSRALESALRDAEFLGPPSPAAMLGALVQPVTRLGSSWEAGFPEEMVAAVSGQASPLPVLQLAASWVWEKRAVAADGSAVLTRSLLASQGEALRIGDVLGQYADHKLRAASWSEGDRELVKRMLPVLVSAEGTPLIVPIDDILARISAAARPRAQVLLRDLTDFRLMTSLRDERARECLTPVHTTLIGGWALMRDALEGSAELESFLRRYERDAREWLARGKDPAQLWPDAALRDFERWAPRLGDVQLTPAQLAFRAAVARHARGVRSLRWGLVGVLAALAIGGAWAGIAFSDKADEALALRQQALSQSALAEQRKTVAEAQTRLSLAHRREADELIDYMLGDLRQRLEKIGQVKVLRVVAEKARDYLDKRRDASAGGQDLAIGASLETAEDAARRAAVLRNLSAVFFEEGDTTQAERSARESLAIVQRLAAANPKDRVAQRDHALSLTSLGVVQVARGDPAGGLESYKSALLIYDGLAASALEDLTAQRDLAVINDRIGDVLTTLGKHEAALAAQRASLQITERLVALAPESAQAKRDLAVAHNKVGTSLALLGDLAAARASREALLPLVEAALAADPSSAQAQRDVAIGRVALGDVLAAQNELKLALESYQIALAIDQRLAAADPSSANAQRDLGIGHNKVGDMKFWLGDAAGAAVEYASALAITERLVAADTANARFQHDLGQTWSRVGNARLAQGDVAAGLDAKKKAVAIAEALVDLLGTDQARVDLAQFIAFHADALQSRGFLAEARVEVARARALMAPLLAKPDGPRAWAELDAWTATLVKPE